MPKINMQSLRLESDPELKRLITPPNIAWPSVAMVAGCYAVYGATITAVFMGSLSIWVGMLINGAASFFAFSPAHEAVHRSLANKSSWNDIIGNLGFFLVIPFISVSMARWVHSAHHNNASDNTLDPDAPLHHGRTWTLPLRWMFFDVLYAVYYFKHGKHMWSRHWRSTAIMSAFCVIIFTVPTLMGYGPEMLMLWLIPTRICMLGIGYTFNWLPHQPHNVSEAEDFYRATTVRVGWYWLMTPLLAYQNYHLVHHMYPRAPFYRTGAIWRHIKNRVGAEQNLAVQRSWSVLPDTRPAGAATPL